MSWGWAGTAGGGGGGGEARAEAAAEGGVKLARAMPPITVALRSWVYRAVCGGGEMRGGAGSTGVCVAVHLQSSKGVNKVQGA